LAKKTCCADYEFGKIMNLEKSWHIIGHFNWKTLTTIVHYGRLEILQWAHKNSHLLLLFENKYCVYAMTKYICIFQNFEMVTC